MAHRSTALPSKNSLSMKALEEKVKEARKDHKIFMVLGGFIGLRESLLNRGWIEKIPDSQLSLVPTTTERGMLALMVKNLPFHFIWQPHSRPIQSLANSNPVINSIFRRPPLNFTAKDGINNCALNYRWYHEDDLTDLTCQRTHVLLDKATKEEFSEDFRRTAFTSFLIFLNDRGDFAELFSTDALGISSDCIDFAIQKIELDIKLKNHEDLDTSHLFDVCAKFPRNQRDFLTSIRQIKNGSKKFKYQSDFLVEVCRAQVHNCVEEIMNQWPHLKYDGYNNMWIMKPIGQSSGNGVTVMDNEERILIAAQTSSKSNFVVQKYVGEFHVVHYLATSYMNSYRKAPPGP